MYVFSGNVSYSSAFKVIYRGGGVRYDDFKCAAKLDIDHSKETRVLSGSAYSLEVMGFLMQSDSDAYKKGALLKTLGPGFKAE